MNIRQYLLLINKFINLTHYVNTLQPLFLWLIVKRVILKIFYKLIYYLINSCYLVLQHIVQDLFNDKPKGNLKAAKMFSV